VLVLYEDIKQALRFLPKAVVLSPEEYQKLLDQIEQLKRQAKPDKPDLPSACRLTGRVEGDLVYLQAQFEFRTDRAGALVNLGCQRAWATDARLDGQLPWLRLGDDGYLVQAEKPGEHKASLDLVLPVVTKKGAKGADRGFDLDLPRAAITTLEQLDLTEGVSEVRLGNRPLRPSKLDSRQSRLEKVPVAPIDHLDLSWKGPAPEPAKGSPLLAATGRIQVRVNEVHAVIDAELTLQVLSGEVAQWQIWLPPLPPGATLEIKPHLQDESRVQGIDRPTDPQNPIATIRLHEPSAEPLHVTLQIDYARPASQVAIGPFIVLGALTQKGDLEVRAPDDLRWRYQMRPELVQREVSEEQRRDGVRAAFTYWTLPAPPNAKQSAPALLTAQVSAVKGAAEARVTHTLHLVESDAEGHPRWQVTTKVDVMPIRTAVDRLEVSLPADYEYDHEFGPEPADLVEDVVLDRQKQTAQVKLASKQVRPFSIKFKGSFMLPVDRQEASLELPRPLTWGVERGSLIDKPSAPPPDRPAVLDRGGDVTVKLSEGLEFLGRPPRAILEMPAVDPQSLLVPVPAKPGLTEFSWHTEKSPHRVELAWQPHRAELPVDSVVDVTLTHRQARVRQRLRFLQPASGQMMLRAPAGLLEGVRVAEGGELNPSEARAPDLWPVRLSGAAGKEHVLTLEYNIPLPEASAVKPDAVLTRRLTIPLVRPVQATRGEARVRLWSEAEERLSLSGGPWEELSTEVVPERDSLPVLVLHAGLPGPASLTLTAQASESVANPVIERVLIQAVIDEGGAQTYRARFVLTNLTSGHLDIDLPAPLSSTTLEVRLDGKKVLAQFRDEAGREVDIGKVARIPVDPALYPKPVILSLSYRPDPSRADGSGPLQVALRPPMLHGAVLLGRPRWQLDLPAGWLPFLRGGGYSPELRWGWHGWLLTPRPAVTGSELERWLTGSDGTAQIGESEPSLVCWQAALAPLQLLLVPQRLWLLACSLIFLALGLSLFFTRSSPLLFWASTMLGGLSLLAVALFRPAVLPVLAYGCEPGVVMLALVIGTQWALQQRYRRQVAFMPGFTRLKPGSSLTRASGIRPREPSTVDQPPKRPSSVVPQLPPGNSAS
jgi:hypothetical protein